MVVEDGPEPEVAPTGEQLVLVGYHQAVDNQQNCHSDNERRYFPFPYLEYIHRTVNDEKIGTKIGK